MLLTIIFIVFIVIVFINHNDKKTINKIRETSTLSSETPGSVSMKELYAQTSNFEKSDLYFMHRVDMVVREKYPNLITWKLVRNGISLRNQAIEIVISLPENIEERIWISADKLIGSFNIVESEVPEDVATFDAEPDDELRGFLIKYAGVIDRKIRFAVEKRLNYAYFEFKNDESAEFMKKVAERLTTTLDGVMCQVKNNQLEMNVQNLLED